MIPANGGVRSCAASATANSVGGLGAELGQQERDAAPACGRGSGGHPIILPVTESFCD